MKQTRNLLMAVYWIGIGVALLLVVLFETSILEPGTAAGGNASAEFITVTTMELLTVASIPLALKMFKLKCPHWELVAGKAVALRKWGLLRLLMLHIPLIANTLFYYVYMNTTFGYMAIIVLICMPFVYPSMGRCLADVEENDLNEELRS